VASVPGIEVEVYSNRFFPCGTPPNSRIQQACETASGAAPIGSPTASDWIFVRDVPAVKMGPGDSNRSHTGGERIPVAEVERAVEVYREAIRTYFDG
jgi:acetylornithine deacetylase